MTQTALAKVNTERTGKDEQHVGDPAEDPALLSWGQCPLPVCRNCSPEATREEAEKLREK